MDNLTGTAARAILESWQREGAINIRPNIQNCQTCDLPLKEIQKVRAFHAEGNLMGIVGGILFKCDQCHKRYYIDETTAI